MEQPPDTRSPGFPRDYRQLLLALAEQHERDVAQARLEASQQKTACCASQQTGNVAEARTSSTPPMLHTPVLTEEWTVEEMRSPGRPNRESASSPRSLDSAQKMLALKAQEQHIIKDQSQTPELPKGDVLSRFVRTSVFDKISACLLLLNAAFIGVQVEVNFQETTPTEIEIIDYIFCVFFLLELGLRLWGFGCRTFFCDPADRSWNIFDFLIVSLSTMDTLISAFAGDEQDSPLGNVSVLRIVRVVRIIRVIRIIRVMKFFQDLRILLSAIASTVKTASFALTLIFFTMYMFGIAIAQLAAEHMKQKRGSGQAYTADSDMEFFFGSVSRTILALFMTIAGGIDWKDAAVPLFEVGALATTFFLLYVCVMTFCIMNVLLGIFCQCAIDSANSDRENVIQMQLQEKNRFVETLEHVFAGWDENGDGKCSFDEFSAHIEDAELQALLRSLDIEPRDAMMLFELCDEDNSGEVDLPEFVTGCITLRGGAKAVHMEKVNNMNKIFTARFDDLDTKVNQLYKECEFWKLVASESRPASDNMKPAPPSNEKSPSAPHVPLSYLQESSQRRSRAKENTSDHAYQNAPGTVYCGEEV